MTPDRQRCAQQERGGGPSLFLPLFSLAFYDFFIFSIELPCAKHALDISF